MADWYRPEAASFYQIMSNARKPYVTVTLQGPEDGGDFGPNTPGTRTSGFQEALDFSQDQSRDLHIYGGSGGLHDGEGNPHNVYNIDQTVRIPWSQDFTVTGGNYVLNYRGEKGPVLQFDSQMNCRYKFGLISSSSPDPVVLIKPQLPGPDDFIVVTACVFDFSAIVSHHPDGNSLMLDASHGPIINSTLFAEETNSTGTGIYLTDNGGRGYLISNNSIHIPYGNQYHARGDCTGLRLGDPGSGKIRHNRIETSCHAPRGAYFDTEKKAYVAIEGYVGENAIGAAIHAQNNVLHLSFFGMRKPGEDIVFEADARDNIVHVMSMPNGLTNYARLPTNKIFLNRTVGFAVETPDFPHRGEWLINTTSLTVQVLIIDPGRVHAWTLRDAGESAAHNPWNLSLVDNLTGPERSDMPDAAQVEQKLQSGLFTGQTFILDPGEAVKFDYEDAPTWRWKAMK